MINKKITAAAILSLSLFLCGACPAKDKAAGKNCQIDTNGFNDSKHHWYGVYEENNVINPEPNKPCYKQTQIKEIADNILLYQRNNGGWPKNYDMLAVLTKEEKAKILKAKSLFHTTFDNHTTYTHIEYLAKAYEITKVKKYKDAALDGIDFTLSAQYPNSGWPQFYPLEDNYSREITFNDDAMTGVMIMLKDIIDNKPFYSFVDKGRREKIKIAFDRGLACILKCQIIDNGKLTGWCQQHDANDLRPATGRAYELPSICNDESANIVLFLMSIDKPGKEIVNSVKAAVKWFEESKISGIRVDEVNAPEVKYPLRVSKIDRKVVEDKSVRPIWARFYELGTHKPLFADRRGVPLYSLAEVDRERRSGYTYYTYEPQKVLDAYSAQQVKRTSGQNTPIVSAMDVYDGFESPQLSGIWETRKFVPGRVVIQSKVVRAGKLATEITIRPGDQIDDEKGSLLERSELKESTNLEALEGHDYSYSFSMFVPKDFPIVPTRLVIAQWKQRCGRNNCEPSSPLIAVRYINGELQITHMIGSEKTVLYATKDNIKNKWLDFKFQIRFSKSQDGTVKAWLNDKQICNYTGINAYPENTETGYPSPSRFYFKMGIYRDKIAKPMTIYVDEYRKKELSE